MSLTKKGDRTGSEFRRQLVIESQKQKLRNRKGKLLWKDLKVVALFI